MTDDTRARPIQSDYYLHRKLVKTTAATYAANAVPNAVKHLQWNDYKADRVEVFDCTTGTLYAVVRARLNGAAHGKPAIAILYERDGTRAIKDEKPE